MSREDFRWVVFLIVIVFVIVLMGVFGFVDLDDTKTNLPPAGATMVIPQTFD